MNYLLIAVLVLLTWSVLDGYRKGFMKTIFSLISWVLVLVICNVATPKVADFLVEETMIDETIAGAIAVELKEMIANSDISQIEQSIPAELRESLFGQGGSIQNALATGGEEWINSSSIIYTVVSVFAFIIVAAVSRVLMLLVNVFLGIASKLPIIGSVDKLLGFVCGGVKGLLVCWVLLAVVGVLSLTGSNPEWAVYISQSQLLTWMQDNNFILNMLVLGQ
ncbi:MAG: CvpA family protein [Agathobacter sp.]|nr:CvpA family protein [Agathobacter sp.]